MMHKHYSNTAVVAIGFLYLQLQPTKKNGCPKKKYFSVRKTQMDKLFKEPQKYIYIHCYC